MECESFYAGFAALKPAPFPSKCDGAIRHPSFDLSTVRILGQTSNEDGEHVAFAELLGSYESLGVRALRNRLSVCRFGSRYAAKRRRLARCRLKGPHGSPHSSSGRMLRRLMSPFRFDVHRAAARACGPLHAAEDAEGGEGAVARAPRPPHPPQLRPARHRGSRQARHLRASRGSTAPISFMACLISWEALDRCWKWWARAAPAGPPCWRAR